MDKKIFDATIARSNEWKEVIFNILQESDETAGCLSLREQLEEMLDVDTVCLSDVDMFKNSNGNTVFMFQFRFLS